MSSLGGSTVSSSYNRLLVLPTGGGDGTNLVPLTDGDGVTEFALKLSTEDISLPINGKLYFDGGSDTYISGTSDKIEFYTNGQLLMKLMKSGSTMWANALTIGEENSASPFFVFQSHQGQPDATTTVHSIQLGGNDYGGDVLLLGRTDNLNTNVVLNAKVGIGTHALYPTGPQSDFHLVGDGGSTCELHMDMGSPMSGIGITTTASPGAGWARRYGFLKASDLSRIGGLIGYGSDDTLERLSLVSEHGNDNGLACYWGTAGTLSGTVKVGIGTYWPVAKLDVRGATRFGGPHLLGKSLITIASGALDIASTEGPYIAVYAEQGVGSDDADTITHIKIDGAEPTVGSMIYLTRAGNDNITLTCGGSTASSIVCQYNEADDGATLSASSVFIGNGYEVAQLLYTEANRWTVMNPSAVRTNT